MKPKRLYSDRRLASMIADRIGRLRASAAEDAQVLVVTRRDPGPVAAVLAVLLNGIEPIPCVKGCRAWIWRGVVLAFALPGLPFLRGWKPSLLMLDYMSRDDLLNGPLCDRIGGLASKAGRTYGSLEKARKRLV